MSCGTSPTARVRVRRNSSRSSSRTNSLFEEITRGGEYRCVPGVNVFNSDGSVRTEFAAQIGNAYIMLPDGTCQRYDDYCGRCSPLVGDVKVNVVFDGGAGKSIFPFQFKGLFVYPHLYYKTYINNEWVTVSGSYLQPTDDPHVLVFYQKPSFPVRIYELYPAQPPQNISIKYPFYFKNIIIQRDHRYRIFVKNRFIVVFGAQLQPGQGPNTLLLYQGPGHLVPVTELFVYESEAGTPAPSVDSTYVFYFKGLPIYPTAQYRVIIDSRWQIVLGSQLRPSTDGSAVIFYKDPNNPVRIDTVVSVDVQSTGGYTYPTPQLTYNNQSPSRQYNSYNTQPQSPSSHHYYGYNQALSPTQAPSPSRHNYHVNYYNRSPRTQPKPSSPSYRPQLNYNPSSTTYNSYQNNTTQQVLNSSPRQPSPIHINLANTGKSVTSPPRRPRTPTSSPTAKPDELPVHPYSPVNNNVPDTNRTYPFYFKGLNIHADRQYQIKVHDSWEIVDGKQLHPARNDPYSLIVNFANYNAAIITDIFLYEPERYTPVNLVIDGVQILPDLKFYVDLGDAGSLIVPGNRIQRHTTKNIGYIWHDGSYHEIRKVRLILNTNKTEMNTINVLSDKNVEETRRRRPSSPVCTCRTTPEPCKIFPIECAKCSRNLPEPSRYPSPKPIPKSPENITFPEKAKPSSPSGILRSPSRSTTDVEKTVKINVTNIHTSSPSLTSSSSGSAPNKPRYFKDIEIRPDTLYSVLLENNTTQVVYGSLIKTKLNRKYVHVTIDNERYKSYFIRPITPDNTESDDITPGNPGVYRIYLNGQWRIIPANNIRPSKRRPGRYVVQYDRMKYLVKAVNVIPVSDPRDDFNPPSTSEYDSHTRPNSEYDSHARPRCESPVHPHPIHDDKPTYTPDHTFRYLGNGSPGVMWGDTTYPLYSSSSDGTPDGNPNIIPLSALYDTHGILKPEYASLLTLNEPHVVLPKKAGYPSSVVPPVINGTLVFPSKQYRVIIDNTPHIVLGSDFKPRKQYSGEYTVKVGDCRFVVPTDATITVYDPAPKTVTFQNDPYLQTSLRPDPLSPKSDPLSPRCDPYNCTYNRSGTASDSDSEEGGYVALIKGDWVKVGPRAVRTSKTQVGFVVVKYGNTVHLISERDVVELQKGEDVIRLECSLPTGRRLIRTWFVKKLPANCLESIKRVSYETAEELVFVLRNSATRNINDRDIRKLTTCIRSHFDSAQIIFEDDYLQLLEEGYGAKSPIWINVRKNQRPQYFKLLEDLNERSYMDKSVSDNSYLDNLTQTECTYNNTNKKSVLASSAKCSSSAMSRGSAASQARRIYRSNSKFTGATASFTGATASGAASSVRYGSGSGNKSTIFSRLTSTSRKS